MAQRRSNAELSLLVIIITGSVGGSTMGLSATGAYGSSRASDTVTMRFPQTET